MWNTNSDEDSIRQIVMQYCQSNHFKQWLRVQVSQCSFDIIPSSTVSKEQVETMIRNAPANESWNRIVQRSIQNSKRDTLFSLGKVNCFIM